ncbi:MAG: TIR domain-containing protein, partial [Bosea sp. (in: a-proteobacteria)]
MTAEPTGTSPVKGRVFISYSRLDSAQADMLAERLAREGYEPLIDKKDIAPGEPWRERLSEMLRKADALVVVASANWLVSEICLWEVEEAGKLGKRTLPVAIARGLERQLPASLAKLNLIYLDDADAIDSAAANVISALGTNLEWVREHTRIGEAAERWRRASMRRSSLFHGADLGNAETWLASRPDGGPQITDDQRDFLRAARQTATRRLQSYVGAALAVALVAGGLAFVANQQRNLAVARQHQAEANLKGAVQAMGSVLFDSVEGLRNEASLPIATQRRLLQTARSGIERLLAVQPGSPELQRLHAVSLSISSDIQNVQGNPEAAIALLDEALIIFEKLAPGGTTALAPLSDLALTLGKRANAQTSTGNLPSAIADATRAVEMGRDLVRNHPNNAAVRSNLATALRHLALTSSRLDPTTDISQLLDEQLALVRPLAETPGANAQAATALIEGLYLRSAGEIAKGELVKARATLEDAFRVASSYARANRNAIWPSEIAASLLVRTSEIDLAEGRTDAARASLFRALQEINNVVERDRANANYMLRLLSVADRLTHERFALPIEQLRQIARNVVMRMEPFARQDRLSAGDLERLARYKA